MAAMGYEVLDADGAANTLSGAPHPPTDVVALDDLPAPRTEPSPRASRTRLPRRDRTPTGPARRLGLDRLAHTSRLAWLLVAAALVVGVAAGSWWTAKHGADVRRAAARSTVTAFATTLEVNPVLGDAGQMADIRIRVFNLGSQPLRILASPSSDQPSVARPLISVVTGTGTVAPGKDAIAAARVPLDCQSDQPLQVRLPVASPDGTPRQLTLTTPQDSVAESMQRDLCFVQGVVPFEASLSGTLDRTRLDLRNNSDEPITVSLDSGSPLTQDASTFLSLTTVPKLPVTVPPKTTRRLALAVTAEVCRSDIQTLTENGGFGYLSFQTESRGVIRDGSSVGVDASPLVGAAIAKACAGQRANE